MVLAVAQADQAQPRPTQHLVVVVDQPLQPEHSQLELASWVVVVVEHRPPLVSITLVRVVAVIKEEQVVVVVQAHLSLHMFNVPVARVVVRPYLAVAVAVVQPVQLPDKLVVPAHLVLEVVVTVAVVVAPQVPSVALVAQEE